MQTLAGRLRRAENELSRRVRGVRCRVARAPPAAPAGGSARAPGGRPHAPPQPPRRRGVRRGERAGPRRVHGRGAPPAVQARRRRGADPRRPDAGGARRPRRVRARRAASLLGHRPHARPPRRGHPVRPADGPGDPLHAVGPGPACRARLPLAGRLPGAGPHRPAEPDLDAGRPPPRRRPAALRAAPEDAPHGGRPDGLRRIPPPDAGRARRALPQARGVGLRPGAERQGVGRRAPGRAHRAVARLHEVRRAQPPGAGGQAAAHPQGARGDRPGADLPLARPERAALPHRRQAGRARPRAAGADREELRLRDGRRPPGRRVLHARLLPARPHDPPGLGAADRPLLGGAGAPAERGPPDARRGARRRARRLRRPPAPGRAGRAPEGPGPHPARVLARPAARLRARRGPRAGPRGGGARAGGGVVAGVARAAASLPVDPPRMGAGRHHAPPHA